MAKSYYTMKKFGYYYSFKKNSIFPTAKKLCKTNNKSKTMGFYKYLKFLVNKNINNEMEIKIFFN